MPTPTSSLYLNSTTPAGLPGYQNAKPQSDNGSPLTSVSFCLPSTGGVLKKASNYTATAADCGVLLVVNSPGAITITLPQPSPFAKWTITVASIGSGTVNITPGALLLDEVATPLPLQQSQSVTIATDGTNYYSSRGAGAGGGGGPSSTPVVVGFVIGNGSAGSNVGPMLIAPNSGSVTKCVAIVKSADAAVNLTFRIKKNGTDVFSADPTIVNGTASGSVLTFTSLIASPLSVTAGDVFSIDITSGLPSWAFTAQLE